jgi:hypothetical protein
MKTLNEGIVLVSTVNGVKKDCDNTEWFLCLLIAFSVDKMEL